MLRRFAIAACLCALAALLGGARAQAVSSPPVRPAQPNVLLTGHFAIHYNGLPTAPEYITQIQAGQLAVYLEQAYTTFLGYGFTAPIDDAVTTPGRIDFYVTDLASFNVAYALEPDGGGSASIDFGKSQIDNAAESYVAAQALFTVFELRWWSDYGGTDNWAYFGSANWISFKATGYPAAAFVDLTPVQGALDCGDPTTGDPTTQLQHCASTSYENYGGSHWTFWELLAQKFGPTFLTSLYAQQNGSGSSALTALQAALVAKGSTLDDVFHDWSVKQMAGGWGIPGLDATSPAVSGTFTTGIATADLGSQTFAVDHLATRYVTFTRGDGAGDHPCFAAMLTVKVTMPSGINARPVLYWNAKGSAPVELTASGQTATATVPWDTCLWSANKAYLSLTNPSTTLNGAQYVVSASVVVDPNTPASPTAPPVQSPVYGGVTDTPTASVPPAITVYGPLLLSVSAASPTLRLIVDSTGDGQVHAMLGGVDLGSPTVRAGNNDLRFTIPASLLSSLRRSLSAGNTLTLTPLSPNGAQAGEAVSREISVTTPATPKAKAKKKKK